MSEKKFVEVREVRHITLGQIEDELPDALLEAFSALAAEVFDADKDGMTPDAYTSTIQKLSDIMSTSKSTGNGLTIRLSLEVVSQHSGDFCVDMGITPQDS